MRQNKKVTKLKRAAESRINWDNQEVFRVLSSQSKAAKAKTAKMEECTDHQVKKRSKGKDKWKGSGFFLGKKATKSPREWRKRVGKMISFLLLLSILIMLIFGSFDKITTIKNKKKEPSLLVGRSKNHSTGKAAAF